MPTGRQRRTYGSASHHEDRDVLGLMAEGRSNGAIAGFSSKLPGMSGTFSANSAWPRRTPTIAGCWPSSATWSPDQRHGRAADQANDFAGHAGMVQAWPVSKRLILPSAMVKAHLVRISPQVSLR